MQLPCVLKLVQFFSTVYVPFKPKFEVFPHDVLMYVG